RASGAGTGATVSVGDVVRDAARSLDAGAGGAAAGEGADAPLATVIDITARLAALSGGRTAGAGQGGAGQDGADAGAAADDDASQGTAADVTAGGKPGAAVAHMADVVLTVVDVPSAQAPVEPLAGEAVEAAGSASTVVDGAGAPSGEPTAVQPGVAGPAGSTAPVPGTAA
ncbi:hypothetical protein, partial [Cellulomonas carbonis]